MRLTFTTEHFSYAGRPRPGVPIILGDDMCPVQPVQNFILWKLLGRGKMLSKLTWEDYGRRLWDFFAFLHSNDLTWDVSGKTPGNGVVARYRDWSLFELGLSRRTVNSRLRLVVEFYEWAQRERHILELPFAYLEARQSQRNHMFVHVGKIDNTVQKPDVAVREWASQPEYLSQEQLCMCRSLPLKPGARLMFALMERVGLRSCEARTFPLKYVFNPTLRAGCRPDRLIRIKLDPRDMWIKFDKEREVDIPFSLMADLHAYSLFERNRLASAAHCTYDALILNVYGRPYTRGAVNEVFKSISAKVGFRARALMLRHSYAIHTLSKLRREPSFEGEPLLYVRDRLGHSDVQVTIGYLRQIDQLTGGIVLAIEDEFDRMFSLPA